MTPEVRPMSPKEILLDHLGTLTSDDQRCEDQANGFFEDLQEAGWVIIYGSKGNQDEWT